MRKRTILRRGGPVLALLAVGLVLEGCQGLTGSSGAEKKLLKQSVNHIVFMVQENRSFDHYFGKLGEYRQANGFGSASDIDGLPPNVSNTNAQNVVIPSFHLTTTCVEELSGDWLESHQDANVNHPGNKTSSPMDGFAYNAGLYAKENNELDVDGARAMGYYDSTDLPYYYFMASEFATSDRWFSPIMSESVPNRIFMQAGTTAGHVHEPNAQFPCCEQQKLQTIYHVMENHGISWKIYYTDTTASGQPLTDIYAYWPAFAAAHAAKIVPISEYFKDLTNGTLPSVAFIQAGLASGRDEHPGGQVTEGVGGNDIELGAKYASELINALMGSSSWKDSVFILSYDEAGSFYDHVPPPTAKAPDNTKPIDLLPKDSLINPQDTFDRTGIRIPLIVISPFSRAHYVSHTVADTTAILKLIETRFDLPHLTNRDRAQMDMTEFFDFQNPPYMTPPTPPDQPSSGNCAPTQLSPRSSSSTANQ